jgi:hypothetical protein
MVDKEFIAYFKLAHGFFNLSMFSLFCYQGWLGWKIRKARLAGAAMPVERVRRHRTLGPVFALWGILGFVSGVMMILVDKGRVMEYPLHFIAGAFTVLAIAAAFLVSRRISGTATADRNLHFRLGLLLLGLYVVQAVLGLAILL